MNFFKNNKTLLVLIVILLLFFSFLFVFIQNRDSSSIEVYKRVSTDTKQEVKLPLTKEDKRQIKKYLKQTDLKETDRLLNCMSIGMYIVYFDHYSISFDDGNCVTYLYDKQTKKSIQIDISPDFKNYIINLEKKSK